MQVPPDRFDYLTARQQQQRRLHDAIFVAAARLLADRGLDGLSVRAVAAEVGASTKVIYSHFGGKSGLVAALYDDGFERLTGQLEIAAQTDGAVADRLHGLAVAYRAFACSAPHAYELMYGPRVRDLAPTRSNRNAARPVQKVIAALFLEGQEQGTFVREDPADQARLLWTVMHGAVSLELTTWFDASEGAGRLDQVVAIFINSISSPQPPSLSA